MGISSMIPDMTIKKKTKVAIFLFFSIILFDSHTWASNLHEKNSNEVWNDDCRQIINLNYLSFIKKIFDNTYEFKYKNISNRNIINIIPETISKYHPVFIDDKKNKKIHYFELLCSMTKRN